MTYRTKSEGSEFMTRPVIIAFLGIQIAKPVGRKHQGRVLYWKKPDVPFCSPQSGFCCLTMYVCSTTRCRFAIISSSSPINVAKRNFMHKVEYLIAGTASQSYISSIQSNNYSISVGLYILMRTCVTAWLPQADWMLFWLLFPPIRSSVRSWLLLSLHKELEESGIGRGPEVSIEVWPWEHSAHQRFWFPKIQLEDAPHDLFNLQFRSSST